jgi:hypothetical protein
MNSSVWRRKASKRVRCVQKSVWEERVRFCFRVCMSNCQRWSKERFSVFVGDFRE